MNKQFKKKWNVLKNKRSTRRWGIVALVALILAIGGLSASVVLAGSMPYASWKDNMQQDGNTYKLDKSKADELLEVKDFKERYYIYNANWPIHVVNPAGDRCDTGETAALLRPAKHEWIHLGRAVVDTDGEKWARYFNGATDFVSKSPTLRIEEYNGDGVYERYYIRDLAERSGASLTIEQNGDTDQDGFQEGTIVIQHTRWPSSDASGPSEAKVGEEVELDVSGGSHVGEGTDPSYQHSKVDKGYETFCATWDN